ncbi:MAG: prepilin-type N-terminal cleavage/methylation domain-containing protein [Tindallia sp. MSAO_Bac2]|nr:MAG: prepilin-type N-terminal cleavage/methylation domain-containing protein [Tindallia sp. MSAO_Bac2]
MKNTSVFKYNLINTRGLTLVEMIIGITIIAMIALYFSPRFIQATHTMEHSRRNTTAATLANRELENLRSMKFDELVTFYEDIEGGGSSREIEEEVEVNNQRYQINTLFIPHDSVNDASVTAGFTIRVFVETDSMIQNESAEYSVQSFFAR